MSISLLGPKSAKSETQVESLDFRRMLPLQMNILIVTTIWAVGGTFVSSALAEGPVIGRAAVIDGDTIEIQGTRIRLQGIDAPESWQTCVDQANRNYQCGRTAAFALDAWLAQSRPTRCEPAGHDACRRMVATCYRADTAEVNRWLVESGYAVDWPKYSHGRYQEAQYAAMAGDRGSGTGISICPARRGRRGIMEGRNVRRVRCDLRRPSQR